MMQQGKDYYIVTVDGVDACGKSSTITETKRLLEKKGHPVWVYKDFWEETRQPELSLVRQVRSLVLDSKVRVAPDELTLLLTTTRLNLINRIAADLDRAGGVLGLPVIILLDRYVFSTYAYQSLQGDKYLIKMCCNYILSLLQPDICIFIDTQIERCVARLERKAKDNFELKHTFEDYTQIVKNYKDIFEYNIYCNRKEPVANVYIIDTQDKNINEVGSEVTTNITNYLQKTKYQAQYVNMEMP